MPDSQNQKLGYVRNDPTPDYSMSDLSQPSSESRLDLRARVEAILFVAAEPISLGQLARALEITKEKVEKALKELEEGYENRGLRLQHHAGKVQLTTTPEAAPLIEHYLGLEATSQLSQPALETLSIVAYQQPITRPAVDAIRGVNSDSTLKTLLGRGLIQEVGRADSPGRPFLYSTTSEFLRYFGLNSLDELPPLDIEELMSSKDNDDNFSLKD